MNATRLENVPSVGNVVDALAALPLAQVKAALVGGFRARENIEDIKKIIGLLMELKISLDTEFSTIKLLKPTEIWEVKNLADLEKLLEVTSTNSERALLTALFVYGKKINTDADEESSLKFQARELNHILADTENKSIENITAALKPFIDKGYLRETNPKTKGPHRWLSWTAEGLHFAQFEVTEIESRISSTTKND